MRSAAAATRRQSPPPSLIEDTQRLRLVGADQRLALPGKDAALAAAGDDLKPGIEHLAALVLAGAEKARRLARLADALAAGDDRLPDFRPLPIADMPHRGGEIGGTDEQPVDPIDRGDRLDLAERLLRLDLDENAELALDALGIILHPSIAVGARGSGDTANTLGRIACRRNGAARLVSGLHKGKEQTAGAVVEQALDQHRLVPRHPNHRLSAAAHPGAQMRYHPGEILGRRLHVGEQPGEAGTGAHPRG